VQAWASLDEDRQIVCWSGSQGAIDDPQVLSPDDLLDLLLQCRGASRVVVGEAQFHCLTAVLQPDDEIVLTLFRLKQVVNAG
jgi:hypothetical protein